MDIGQRHSRLPGRRSRERWLRFRETFVQKLVELLMLGLRQSVRAKMCVTLQLTSVIELRKVVLKLGFV